MIPGKRIGHYATRSAALVSLLWLALMLVGCGVDDTTSKDSASQVPEPIAAVNVAIDPPSTAQSLLPPALAVPPVAVASIPATTDEPPPLAPGIDASRVAVAQSQARRMPTPTVLRTAITTALEEPTDLAVLPDGTVFFTQRRRGLFVQPAGAPARGLFAPAAGRSESAAVLAVAVDPAFDRNRYVFVHVRSARPADTEHSVVRLALDEAASRVLDQRAVLQVSVHGPAAAPEDLLRSASALRFGPDGYLYVGLDDGASPEAAQSRQTLAGKLLRIDRDGKAAPGNNAGEGADARVFAVGFRQPAAIAFHPANEALLVGERRAAQPDEIILANPGANAGWDPRCAASKGGYCDHLAEQREAARPTGTVTGWRGVKAGEGLAAVAPLRGESWGLWRNGFVVAFDRAQRLDLLKFDGQGRITQSVTALERAGVGFRAVAQGPDGLYVATSGRPGSDQIWRLTVR